MPDDPMNRDDARRAATLVAGASGPPPARPRRGGLRRVALIGSVALNIALLGFLIGRAWMGGEGEAPQPRSQTARESAIFLSLTPEDRRAAAAMRLDATRAEVGRSHRLTFAEVNKLIAALEAHPFDAAAYRQSLRAIRAQGADRRAHVHETMVLILEEFDRADRAEFAERLKGLMARLSDRASGG